MQGVAPQSLHVLPVPGTDLVPPPWVPHQASATDNVVTAVKRSIVVEMRAIVLLGGCHTANVKEKDGRVGRTEQTHFLNVVLLCWSRGSSDDLQTRACCGVQGGPDAVPLGLEVERTGLY